MQVGALKRRLALLEEESARNKAKLQENIEKCNDTEAACQKNEEGRRAGELYVWREPSLLNHYFRSNSYANCLFWSTKLACEKVHTFLRYRYHKSKSHKLLTERRLNFSRESSANHN